MRALPLALVLILGVAPALSPGAAHAQSTDVKQLIDRIDRLQRELNTLQRQVYKGEPPPEPVGEPTEPGGGLTTAAAARIELRLSQFEAELRALTGQVEETTHRSNQLRERLERLAADTDQRLQRLEQGAPAQMSSLAPGQPGQTAPGAAPQAPSSAEPQVLGSINQSDLEALRRQQVERGAAPVQAATDPGTQPSAGTRQSAAAMPGATAQEQYDHAFSLLSQANYAEAASALRQFVEQYPTDPLAGNAKYWLGETYYVRQDYQQAAVTFAEAYQEYPDSTKAPDNLLKLGMSLSALDSKNDACGTFAELMKRYPDAAVTVIQRAKQERQRLACP